MWLINRPILVFSQTYHIKIQPIIILVSYKILQQKAAQVKFNVQLQYLITRIVLYLIM